MDALAEFRSSVEKVVGTGSPTGYFQDFDLWALGERHTTQRLNFFRRKVDGDLRVDNSEAPRSKKVIHISTTDVAEHVRRARAPRTRWALMQHARVCVSCTRAAQPLGRKVGGAARVAFPAPPDHQARLRRDAVPGL
jgi:hypothetical protein